MTSIPFFAKRPFSCATQTGQLNPPGNTMRLTGLGGAGCALVHETSSIAINASISLTIPFMFFSSFIFSFRIAVGQVIPHALGDAPLPDGSGFGLFFAHARRAVGEPGVERRELDPCCVL